MPKVITILPMNFKYHILKSLSSISSRVLLNHHECGFLMACMPVAMNAMPINTVNMKLMNRGQSAPFFNDNTQD